MTKVDVALAQGELKCDNAVDEFPNLDGSEHVSAECTENVDAEIHENLSSSKSDFEDSADISSKRDFTGKVKSATHRKRELKPYSQLSGRERQRLEERNMRRALRIREEKHAYGFTLPICHARQISVEEEQCEPEPKFLDNLGGQKDIDVHPDSCEGSSESPENEDCVQRDFDDAYDDMYSECLNCKSKSDLAWDFLNMEDKVENLEKCLREARLRQTTLEFDVESELEKIRVFREEIEKLTRENALLRTFNDKLRLALPCQSD